MSQKCIKMGFRADSSSTIVIDDDKMRDRSPSAGVELSWTRSKSPKTFGPVNNVVSSLATNLFLSSTMTFSWRELRRVHEANIFHRARTGPLFATFGCVWSCALVMPLEAALKCGTMQVVI